MSGSANCCKGARGGYHARPTATAICLIYPISALLVRDRKVRSGARRAVAAARGERPLSVSKAGPPMPTIRPRRALGQGLSPRAAQIAALDAEINRRSKSDPTARRLITIPGVGPIVSTAITALVPAAEGFPAGRDFAAWLGLTPLQKSTGGKQRLGAVSKRGERTIRRLLIIGASAVVQQASRAGHPTDRGLRRCWLASRKCWSPSLWPTRWPVSSGLCWSKAARTELR